jgi:hypothetical protein
MVYKAFQKLFTVLSLYFASLKLFTNFGNAYWNPPQNSLLLFVDVLHCRPSLMWGKMRQIQLSQTAFGTGSQAASCIHFFRVKIAALGSLKRVIESVFKISLQFQRSKLKCWLDFFNKKGKKNCKNQQRIYVYRKYLSNNTDLLKIYSSRDPIPWNS